jgi:hypothetical protein
LAQPEKDTAFLQTAIQNTIQFYQKTIGAQAKLYNGSRYKQPINSEEQHPYFISDDWIMGDVFYDGEIFQNVPLMYDLYNDKLVTEHYSSGNALQLIDEKLHSFEIAGHHFEKIDNQSVGGSLPRSDYYDILYPGTTKVIARRQKFLREQIVSNEIETSYDEKVRYYIFKNGVYFLVNKKGSVLKLLGDKKQPLKKFLKSKQIYFSKDKELALQSMSRFYDSLNAK